MEGEDVRLQKSPASDGPIESSKKESTNEPPGNTEAVSATIALSKNQSLFTINSSANRIVEIHHAALDVKIGEKVLEMCLDTGAGKNYLSAEELSERDKSFIETDIDDTPVKHAGGGRMCINGVVRKDLTIGSRRFKQVLFRVAAGLPVSAILGNDFITRQVAAIYPPSQQLRFIGGGTTRFRVKRTQFLNPLVEVPVRVRSLEKISLPPESVTPVRVGLDQILGTPALIRRNARASEIHGILPSQVIIPAGVREMTVLIGNFGQNRVDLLPKQCVAECEVESVDQMKFIGFLPQKTGSTSQEKNPNVTSSAKDILQQLRLKTRHLDKENKKD